MKTHKILSIVMLRPVYSGITRSIPWQPIDSHGIRYDVIKWKHLPSYWPFMRPVTRSCDVFLDVGLYTRLSKQLRYWWFERSWRSLWHHCNGLCRIDVFLSSTKYFIFLSNLNYEERSASNQFGKFWILDGIMETSMAVMLINWNNVHSMPTLKETKTSEFEISVFPFTIKAIDPYSF